MNNDQPVAVVYYRCSTSKQDTSVATQRARVGPHFAAKYRIAEEYLDDGKSGSKDTEKRVDFLRMVHDLSVGKHAGKVQAVLCLDTSRFGRLNTIRGAKYKEALMDAGVVLDTVTDGLIDWRTGVGRIVDTVRAEGNHETALLIAEKGLAGRIRVTKEGRPNQTTPYGMAKLVTSPTGEKIVIRRGQRFTTPKTWKSVFVPGDEREAAAIRFMFSTFDGEDLSYNELARRLDQEGFPPPGSAGRWQADTIAWMLRNPVYAGNLRIGVTPRGEFFRTQGEKETPADKATVPAPVIAQDTHEGIIGPDLFKSVQNKIARTTKKRRPPRNNGPYALSGILRCGNCGGAMYGSRNPDGRVIYRCHNVEVGPSTCCYWIAYEAEILPFILKRFLLEIARAVDEAARLSDKTPPGGELASMNKELARLDRKLATARERFLEAPAKVAGGLLETLQKWESERAALLGKIEAASHVKPNPLLGWWRNYEQEFVADAVVKTDVADDHADALPAGGETLTISVGIPAAALREKLKKISAKVSVWFRRKAKGRGYDLDKIRVQALVGGQVCYEYASNAAS